MEPARTAYVIQSTVIGVVQHKTKKWVSGFGDNAIFEEYSTGWFLHLAGSHEAIFLGLDKPDFKFGDQVSITIKKEP